VHLETPSNPWHNVTVYHSLHQCKLVHHNPNPQTLHTGCSKYCLSQLFSCLQTTPSRSRVTRPCFIESHLSKRLNQRACCHLSLVLATSPSIWMATASDMFTPNNVRDTKTKGYWRPPKNITSLFYSVVVCRLVQQQIRPVTRHAVLRLQIFV
jgi:hypothetical protein